MSDKTALKEHENKVQVVATLSEMHLEKKKATKKIKTKDGEMSQEMNVISGTIVGKLSETNSITLRSYASELTNAGSENKVYKHLETLMNEWPSIAKEGTDAAIRFSTYADFSPTHYIGTNDQKMHEGVPQYRANFYTKIEDKTNEDGSLKNPNKAEIRCDLYVSSVRPENGPDGETGRWFVDGWVSLFTGVEKATFVVPAEIADGISDYIHTGETVEIYANVVNTQKTEKIIKKMGIGADHEEIKTTFKNELVLTGANVLNDSENPADLARVFNDEEIKNAINEYKKSLDSIENGGGVEKVSKAPAADTKPLW